LGKCHNGLSFQSEGFYVVHDFILVCVVFFLLVFFFILLASWIRIPYMGFCRIPLFVRARILETFVIIYGVCCFI